MVLPISVQSIFAIAEPIVTPIAFPRLSQCVSLMSDSVKPTAVFIPSLIVFPISYQSVSSTKPLKSLAIFVPVSFAKFFILFQSIFFYCII